MEDMRLDVKPGRRPSIHWDAVFNALNDRLNAVRIQTRQGFAIDQTRGPLIAKTGTRGKGKADPAIHPRFPKLNTQPVRKHLSQP